MEQSLEQVEANEREKGVVSMTESGGQQQQLSPAQRLGRAVAGIREVEKWMELNYPQHGQEIQVLREAGDLVTGEIQRMQQKQQQQGS